MKRNIFLYLILTVLLVFGSRETLMLSSQNQILKSEIAEINDIKHALLNVHAWKHQVDKILFQKIDEFQFDLDKRENLKNKVEDLLLFVINEAERILILEREQSPFFSNVVRAYLVEWVADFDDIRSEIPNFADHFVNELGVESNITEIKNFIKVQLKESLDETFGREDRSEINSILAKYSCKIVPTCTQQLQLKIEKNDSAIYLYIGLLFFVSMFLSVLIRNIGSKLLYNSLILCLLSFLVIGINIPMIDLDARILDFSLSLMGRRVNFQNQILFFQSKSILDVCYILLYSKELLSKLIGVLIFLFSVLLPFGKIVAALFSINNSSLFKKSPILKFLLHKTGKWSMADVMVIAIFMSYIGFRGTINSQLSRLGNSVDRVELLTTNETSLQIGFFAFLAFTLIGIYFSGQINKQEI